MNLTFSEQIMYSVLQVLMFDKGNTLKGTATGFIFGFCENDEATAPILALVTNRHVVSNCEYISVIFTLATKDNEPDVGRTIQATISTRSAVYHPNPNVDLAAIPLGPCINALFQSNCPIFFRHISISHIPSVQDWKEFDAIEPVIMLGYPRGLRDQTNNLPIFRRGITATHPAYDFQGNAEFLVDMPCFEGCSGSPVFILEEGTYWNKRAHSMSIGGERIFFLGVQRAIPDVKSIGSIELFASNNTQLEPKPVVSFYLNL